MKKTKLFFIAMLLAAISQHASALTVGDVFTQGGFDFKVLSANTVSAIRCTLSGSVEIPSTVTYDAVVYTVTTIGNGNNTTATSWNSEITSITIPNTVTNLDFYAFNGCRLTELEIPASLTTITRNIQPGRQGFKKYTVAEGNQYFEADENGVLYTKDGGLVQIPYDADIDEDYVLDSRVTKLNYPLSIQHLRIKSLTIPASVTQIDMSNDPGAFYGERLQTLTAIKVADGNEYFKADDNGVLYDKTGTTLIYYPAGKRDNSYTVDENVTVIGSFALSSNRYIKTLNLNNAASLSLSSVYSISSLTTLYIGKDVTMEALTGAVVGCANIQDYIISDENPYVSSVDGAIYSADKTSLLLFPPTKTGDYTFPEEIDNLKTIEGRAFSSSQISSIEIPATVTGIGQYGFASCPNLTTVTFAEPSSITTLATSAFRNNTALVEFTLPTSLLFISNSAFYGCTALTTVHVPDGSQLKEIQKTAFRDCDELTTFDIQGTCQLRLIGEEAFADKPKLEAFNMPGTVETISNRAFANCQSLATVTFADGAVIRTIGTGAFADCGIENITLPSSVRTIEEEAFRNCTALTKVTLGSKANSVNSRAFKGCTNLTDIEVVDDNPTYSSVQGFLCNKEKTTLLLFPPGAAREDFTLLPPSLTSIGENSFYDVEGLTNICIPKNITNIQRRAFGLDNNLNSVALLGDVLIDPSQISQNSETDQNLNAFDDGTVDGTVNMFDNITLYLTKAAYTDWTDNHKDTDDAYDKYYKQFKEIKTTFTVANATCGGNDEFLPVSRNSANLLTTTSTKETYVVPASVNNTEDGYYYNVNLIGDYAFQSASPNIKEVVMNSKVGYIGSNAFDNENIEQVVFTNATPADYLSTEYFGLNDNFNEFKSSQKIYVRADALADYQSAWEKYKEQIGCDIPLKSFEANDAMPFSREFDVDLTASDGESTPVLAYVPYRDAGLGRNTAGDLIEYIEMQTLRPTVGGTRYEGTYIPAGTPVVLHAGEAAANATYRIGTKGSTAPVTVNGLTGALYEDATKTVASDAYGYYSLDANGNGTRSTGNVTIDHNSAFLDATDYLATGVPAEKAILLFEAPSTERTTLVLTNADAENVSIMIDYEGPISFGSGLTYTDYNDIPKPTDLVSFKRDLSTNVVTFVGKVTRLNCNKQALEEISSLPSSLTYLDCRECGITELDVTGCESLDKIYCQKNKLTQLDLSHNDALTGGNINQQSVSGYLIVNEDEMICLRNDANDQTYVIRRAVNDYETKGGSQDLEVETGAKLDDLKIMQVTATAGKAHVQKVSSVGAATLYLNFAADIPDGVQAFYCGGIDGDLTYLYNLSGAVQANQGFFVKADEGWYVWNAATKTPADISSDNIFRGSTSATECEPRSVLTLGRSVSAGRLGFCYYLGSQIPAYRSYISISDLDSYAKQQSFFDLVFDEDATSIRNVNVDVIEGDVYDLSGRKVDSSNLKKGIYIVNGRKVVINK